MQDCFVADILSNRHNRAILDRWDELSLPDAWLVAGCLFQTVWNLQAGRPAEYEAHFGHPYGQLRNSRDGIDRFLVPATCVGIRPGEVYAPNGLALLYEGVLTMNPLVPHRDLFERKVASYRARWNWLRVQPAGRH